MTEYTLEIVEGPETGRQVTIGGPLEIGRDPAAGLVLDSDELVSRKHARLVPAEDGVTVEDLDSRNGTFVNGDEIHSPAHLRSGGQLLIGVTLMELRSPQELAVGVTAVRPVPVGLTALRPLSTAPVTDGTTLREIPAPLAKPASTPEYVPQDALPAQAHGDEVLTPLLDIHTKSKAKTAPLAVFVLVALVVLVYLVVGR